MSTDDDDRVHDDGTGDGRVERLLRGAGDLEQAPPAHVWAAIRDEVGAEVARDPGEPPARRRGSRAGRAVPLLLAAAAGAGVMYAATNLLPDQAPDPTPETAPVATAQLGPVDGEGRLGEAEVIDRDGRQVLHVTLDELPDAEDGYLEVWLLRPDVSGLVTLGVLDATEEEFVLPEGIDLTEFPVVDISVEHLDGDPGHGGVSVVRGSVS